MTNSEEEHKEHSEGNSEEDSQIQWWLRVLRKVITSIAWIGVIGACMYTADIYRNRFWDADSAVVQAALAAYGAGIVVLAYGGARSISSLLHQW